MVTPITLLGSNISQQVTQDGKTVSIRVYKADKAGNWMLEIVDKYWNSTTWDEVFPSAQAAIDEGVAAIDEEGIDAFIGEPSNAFVEEHLEMHPAINRAAIVIRVKQPFVDWINSVETRSVVTLAEANDEPSIYLVDRADEIYLNEYSETVRSFLIEIFESELSGWCADDALWPEGRDWELFQQFFEYTSMSVVYDLGVTPLEHED